MNARTALTIAAAALAFAAPSLASQRPGQDPYSEARYELSAMQRDAYQLRDGWLRNDLLGRIQRTQAIVTRIEAEARQNDREHWDNGNHNGWDRDHHGDDHHGSWDRDDDGRGMTFDEALARVQRESFDSGKLEVIQRLVERQQFTSREAPPSLPPSASTTSGPTP